MPQLPLRILYITLRADHGGGPKHLFDLISVLPESVEPFIATPADKPYFNKFLELCQDEQIIQIPHRAFSVKSLFQLKNFCLNHSIAIIHSHGKGAGLYSRLLSLLTGIPTIHTFHGIHIGNYSTIKKHLYLLLERVFAFFTGYGIAVSASEQQRIISLGFFPSAKLVTIPNGVHIPQVPNHSFETEKKTVLHITRFDYAKDPELLYSVIEHFRGTSDFHFIVIGEGREKKNLEEKLRAAQLENLVTFTGAVDNPEHYYTHSFCYLSTSRWEGLPLSVLEAMAYGVPAVLSNVTGNSDCIEDGISGFLYPREQSIQAAECIHKLSAESRLYKSMSEQAAKRVRTYFSLTNMGESTVSLYFQLSNPK